MNGWVCAFCQRLNFCATPKGYEECGGCGRTHAQSTDKRHRWWPL